MEGLGKLGGKFSGLEREITSNFVTTKCIALYLLSHLNTHEKTYT